MHTLIKQTALTGVIAAAICVPAITPAAAQGIPVHDNASLIQQIQQVKQAVDIINQGREQIAEAQKLYNDLNGLTDISQLAQQLKSDALRELGTDGASLGSYASGDLGGIGEGRARAQQAYQDIIGALGQGAGSGDERFNERFDYRARRIATDTVLAENIGAAVGNRQAGLEQLRERFASAVSAKEVQDLTARLQAESALMANDRMRLEAIDRAINAEQAARSAKARAARQNSAREDQAYFRGEQ